MLPGASVAQQKSMKDQLVGAWTLLLTDLVKADGTHVPAFGPNPTGIRHFQSGRALFLQIMRANLPKFASNNRDKGTPTRTRPSWRGMIAHFGTYSVNEADKSLNFRIESSSFPNWSGTQQKRPITALTDDVLTYTTPNPSVAPSTNVRTRAGVATGEVAAAAAIGSTAPPFGPVSPGLQSGISKRRPAP